MDNKFMFGVNKKKKEKHDKSKFGVKTQEIHNRFKFEVKHRKYMRNSSVISKYRSFFKIFIWFKMILFLIFIYFRYALGAFDSCVRAENV